MLQAAQLRLPQQPHVPAPLFGFGWFLAIVLETSTRGGSLVMVVVMWMWGPKAQTGVVECFDSFRVCRVWQSPFEARKSGATHIQS